MTSPGIVRMARDRFHPLLHARRIPVLQAGLCRLDVPVWGRLEGVDWPVRMRAVRHASYLVRSAGVEREMAALARAIAYVLSIRRFCDVGANFGFYAWLLKSRLPHLEVDLVEPESENLELIDATLGRTPLSDVSVHRVAASDVSGTALFQRDVVSGATGTLESAEESFAARHWSKSATTQISTCPLDRLLTAGVDFLKIDVEGHEERVLVGASTLLRRDAPVVVFECFHGGHAASAFLRSLEYDLYDAESLAEPTASTTNFLALPRRFRDRRHQLYDAWLGALGG